MKYKCFCCECATLEENPNFPTYEICPVCFWENDPIQNDKPDLVGGANVVCLIDAKKNYASLGACEERFINQVIDLKKEYGSKIISQALKYEREVKEVIMMKKIFQKGVSHIIKTKSHGLYIVTSDVESKAYAIANDGEYRLIESYDKVTYVYDYAKKVLGTV